MGGLLGFILLVFELLLLLVDELEERVVLGLVLFELVDDLRASIDMDILDEFEVLLAKEAILSGQFLELVLQSELTLEEDGLSLFFLISDDLEFLLLIYQHLLIGLSKFQLVLSVFGIHVLDDLLQTLELQQRLIAL